MMSKVIGRYVRSFLHCFSIVGACTYSRSPSPALHMYVYIHVHVRSLVHYVRSLLVGAYFFIILIEIIVPNPHRLLHSPSSYNVQYSL